MLPEFFVEETVVREAGESQVFDCGERTRGENTDHNLLLTLGITHATEQESIEITIFDSRDGLRWRPIPVAQFTPKYYCGTYQLSLPARHERFLKAAWRVERWGAGGARPYFGFYLKVSQPFTARVLTHAAG